MTIVPASSALMAVVLCEPQVDPQAVWQACGAHETSRHEENAVGYIDGWNGALLLAGTSARAIPAGDLVIGYIDGDVGLSAEFAQAWTMATDNDVPRVLLIDHSISGRADFDEVVAIAQRVLGDDVLTRFVPLSDDDGQSLAGIFDILRNLVITADDVRTGDPEHVVHTSDARTELMDALAHMGLPDHALDRHLSGNPVSVPALANSWLGDFVVGALPVDGGIAADTLLEWLQARQSRWMPIVVDGDVAIDASDFGQTIGIGICQGVARVWGPPGDLVVARDNSEQVIHGESPVTLHRSIVEHDTLRTPGSLASVLAPGL